MERRIWKFDLRRSPGWCTLWFPEGAQILHVAAQRPGEPRLWALVDPNAVQEARDFLIVGTGEPFDPTGMTYVATWLDGPWVWHLWEAQRETLPVPEGE